ncbi:MFS transporter [Paenarthrobacter aurescens]|uniref:MFS transporter n=1 Tax=Paenarthrobacter aurescens TaxID=43663 RepID=A0A4Y3NQ82_PAEAU|nr:MFS transporter [Paenarthrobacter aurescens]MDO6142550.1 MHS family MFS transporter [Paenarthrobacter aurescens]MDO6146397.1 MHS family MFS transporter [Paenarthrobacter aurescens]MDO6157642.1 MHS family MFS transporter [Paenarthrobacter aurescens]MDO6161627.1 MHS family MFS transporter [Paenarthrobacter aurescens]GEB21101.1 MFS transporter [Paenarthrobacter aurescens]
MSGHTALAQSSTAAKRKEARTVIMSSYLGSTIEFYDFLLYATAAAVAFPKVFFAGTDEWVGVVAAYATFAAGYVARPLGGIIFGHFGDRIGRKGMLIVSMAMMGIASTLIGLIPGANVIGPWGAVILVVLRVCQGIAVGGEWGGAALMALEHSDPKKRGFAASFVNAGAPTGAVLGTVVMGIFSALPQDAFLAWGWRVPFLLSFVLLIVGMFVRLRVSESPIFAEAVAKESAQGTKRKIPLLEVLKRPKALIMIMFAGAAGFGLQVVLPTFSVTYAVSKGAPQQGVLYAFAGASAISILFVLLGGRLSDRFGRRPVMVTGLALFILYLFPMFGMLSSGNIALVFLAFTVALVLHSSLYGPLAAFVSEQFGTTNRYTGAAVGYQLATLIGAGFTPGIVAGLYKDAGQSIVPVVVFLSIMSLVSIVFILLTRESKNNDLSTVS